MRRTDAPTPILLTDDLNAAQSESERIDACTVAKVFCFALISTLNFASLRNEREHRDIALRCLDSEDGAVDGEVRVHRRVLSLWSSVHRRPRPRPRRHWPQRRRGRLSLSLSHCLSILDADDRGFFFHSLPCSHRWRHCVRALLLWRSLWCSPL